MVFLRGQQAETHQHSATDHIKLTTRGLSASRNPDGFNWNPFVARKEGRRDAVVSVWCAHTAAFSSVLTGHPLTFSGEPKQNMLRLTTVQDEVTTTHAGWAHCRGKHSHSKHNLVYNHFNCGQETRSFSLSCTGALNRLSGLVVQGSTAIPPLWNVLGGIGPATY